MRVIIIGDGGHSQVIQELIFSNKEYEVIAILDDKYNNPFTVNGMIHAPIAFLVKLFTSDTKLVVAIGNNETRKQIVEKLNIHSLAYLTMVHPTAVISPSAKIGNGSVILPNAVINARAEIGKYCIINTGAIVEHDNVIGDYTHISPNATLTGNVSAGDGVHVGSSATIIPGKHIGSWSIIGAGSTVIENIPAYSKAVGSPTRIIERIMK